MTNESDGLLTEKGKNERPVSDRLTGWRRVSHRVFGSLDERNDIGYWGSIALLTNQMMGPGMLVLPVALLNTGWFIVTILHFLVTAVSVLSSLMVIEAISKIQGNGNFEIRVEFTTLVQTYLSARWALAAKIGYYVSLTLMNIAGIVLCAQATDNTLIWIFGETWVFELEPHFKLGSFIEKEDDQTNLDSINHIYSGYVHSIGITLGYIVVALVTIPMGRGTISGSIKVQIVTSLVTVASMIVFFYHFCHLVVDNGPFIRMNKLSAFEEGNYSVAVTAVLISYMVPVYTPTWINEKSSEVSAFETVTKVPVYTMIAFILVSIACAVAMPELRHRNVIQYLYENTVDGEDWGHPGSRNAFYRVVILVFTFTAILPKVVINSINLRYNYYASGSVGPSMAWFYGSILPFLVGWLFTSRELSVAVVLWTLLFTGTAVNYILPPYLYYRARTCGHFGVPLHEEAMFDASEAEDADAEERAFSGESSVMSFIRENPGYVTIIVYFVVGLIIILGMIWRIQFDLDPDNDWLSADPTPKIQKELIDGIPPP